MNISSIKRPLAAAVAGIFLLSACATNPDGSYKMDGKAAGALIGAAAGCAVGAAAKGAQGCAVGAAVGAAAGFLIGWYFESKKIADASRSMTNTNSRAEPRAKARRSQCRRMKSCRPNSRAR